MGLFRVQYADGPVKEIPALNREEAWDTYKVQTGLRRKPGDNPPIVEEIQEEVNREPDSGGNRQPENDSAKPD